MVSRWPRLVGFGEKTWFQFRTVRFSDKHLNQLRHSMMMHLLTVVRLLVLDANSVGGRA